MKNNNSAITQTTLITGLFGYPVSHSLSPAMHNAAFAHCRLPYVYLPFAVHPENLKSATEAIRALGLAGVNVTIPHKETILPFLDRIDPAARKIGSVNTVVNNKGTLTGYNTDAPGFLKDIQSRGFDPSGTTSMIVGSGGAAKAVARGLVDAGVKKLFITSNDIRQATSLVRRLSRTAFVPLSAWKEKISQTDILVNATPVGMKTSDAPLATARELHKNLFVYDLIYSHPTGLIQAARAAGAPHADGLGMLLFQGALSFERWTGENAPVAVMRAALLKAIKNNKKK
ncbi:MAG: shikimate dehydrogenase [Endomicrobiales bacterium]